MAGDRQMTLKVVIEALDHASQAIGRIGASLHGLEGSLRAGQAASEQFNARWSATMTAARGVGATMTAAGVGAMALAKSGLDASMEMEGYGAKLQVAMKDTAKAAEMMDWAKQTAAKTPFEMPDVVDATAKMEMYGLSAKEWFPQVGDMAAAMGKDVVQGVEAIADAVSGGGLERLKEFGVTGEQLKQFGWSGDYSAKGIESLKTALQGLLSSRFEGGMEKMMGTSKGALSNFGDAVFQVRAAIGDALAPALKAITPALVGIATWLAEIAKSPVGAFFIQVGMAAGGLMLVLGPLLYALPSIASGFVFIKAAIGGAGLVGALAQASGAVPALTGGLTAAAGAATATGTAAAGATTSLAGMAAAAAPILVVVAALAALGYELYKVRQAYLAAADAGRQAKASWEAASNAELQAAQARGAGDIAAQKMKEREEAKATLGERFWGAVTGGGVTSKDLASQRVAAGQSSSLYDDMKRRGRVRAEGGPVDPREAYIVGEEGPEVFVPEHRGRIITSDALDAITYRAPEPPDDWTEQKRRAVATRTPRAATASPASPVRPTLQGVTGESSPEREDLVPMIPAVRTGTRTSPDVLNLNLTLSLEPGIIVKGAVDALQTAQGREVVVRIARATAAKSPGRSTY